MVQEKHRTLLTALFLATASASASGAELSFEPNTALWGAETLRAVGSAPLNPGNSFASIPCETELLEARPDWRLLGAGWKLTARPRFLSTRDTTRVNGATRTSTLALLRWSEAFATWNLSEAISLDYGLQNFQWGPAESASPSNRLFRDTVQVKDSLYVVRGQHLARLTYSPSSSWSEVLLLEPTGNGDGEPEPNEPHSLKAALRSEFSWAGGSDFAGLVAGWRDRAGLWAGGYANLEVLSGFFVYADAEVQAGDPAYYPARDPVSGLVLFSQSRRFDTRLSPFAVGGLRYAFENGNDWRLEWIYQSLGYSTGELGLAKGALASRNAIQLAALAAQAPAARASGLDFPSRHYLFSSIRFPNAFGTRDWTLYLRGLASLQDHSASALASSESRLGERGTLVGDLAATFGPADGELKGMVDFAATLAYRHAL